VFKSGKKTFFTLSGFEHQVLGGQVDQGEG